MNPLTLVKRIQQINSREAALGISEGASWHAKYKESAYVYVGGIPFDLTEGDLLAVFAQYGEVVDVNLVRDKGTGKSKGFCFIAYEDQRSTNLAVDNLNGASVLGRIIRVDHVTNYKKKQEEDEEEAQRKREERGVCRAFQKGECNRGASCKFSHNEQRAANTGWGAKDNSRWEQDKYEGPSKGNKSSGNSSQYQPDPRDKDRVLKTRSDRSGRLSKPGDSEGDTKRLDSRSERYPRDQNRRDTEKGSERYEKERNHKDWDRQATEKKSSRHDYEPNLTEDRDRRGKQESSGRYKSEPEPRRQERSEKLESERSQREAHVNNGKEERLRSRELEPNTKEDRHHRGDEKRSRHDRDSSYRHHEEETDGKNRRSHR